MKSTFLHVGHSLLPLLSAVVMHSEQNLCRHSFVVIVFLKTSRQIGHMSNALSDFRCTFMRGYKLKVARIFSTNIITKKPLKTVVVIFFNKTLSFNFGIIEYELLRLSIQLVPTKLKLFFIHGDRFRVATTFFNVVLVFYLNDTIILKKEFLK